jgi:hypothetical protein
MSRKPVSVAVNGGMDLVTPAVALPPGRVIAALNYEPTSSGYRRFRGYERYDGQYAPSEVTSYFVLHFTDLVAAPAIGSFLRGATSGARLYVAAAPVILTGALGGTNTGYIAGWWTALDGHFVNAETLRLNALGGSPYGFNSGGDPIENEAVTGSTTLLAAAVAAMRGRIAPVTGAGAVRGVFLIDGHVVAVRDDASPATKGVMQRAGNGWSTVSIASTYSFNSGGPVEMVAGESGSVFGETSGAGDFHIASITVTSGTWAAGDAAGTLSVIDTGGHFTNGENLRYTKILVDSYANNATITSTGTAYALPAGGAYEFIGHNFYGASNLRRIYGVNGVGPAFQYDPTTTALSPISTGMTVDTPNHIAEHRNALFLSFPGGALESSVVGEPANFNGTLGAVDIGVGSDITGLIQASGEALAVFAENSVSLLYGNDTTDYQLQTLSPDTGGKAFTAQRFGDVIYLDNAGIRSLSTTSRFANFTMGSISQLVAKLLEDYANDGVQPVASLISRRSSQYWIFFDNGAGLVVYLGAKQPWILPFVLGVVVTCACSAEFEGGERMFIGCENGYVYELNKGTSFDGDPIDHYVRFPFNAFGSPQMEKTLEKVVLDIETTVSATLSASVDFNYGSIDGTAPQEFVVVTGGAAIDDLGSNELYYSSQIEAQAEVYIDGYGKNFSLKVGGSTSDEEPHTLTAITFYVGASRVAG